VRRACSSGGNRVICIDQLSRPDRSENIEHIRTEQFEYRQVDIIERLLRRRAGSDFVYHTSPRRRRRSTYLRLPLHTLKVGS